MLGEFDLIRRYFTPSPSSLTDAVIAGVGDDCAVLRLLPHHDLAISVDTQVSGVHFHPDADPANIATRALRCAASDLAANGADPVGFTLALTLPCIDERWLEAFSRGLLETAQQLHCPLVGGDTTRGPLTVTVQVHGSVPAGQSLRRCGAQPGDTVWVSGTLGDGAAALAVIENRLFVPAEAEAYLLDRFYRPAVDVALGVALRGIASSCIDVSDGLIADLGHVCRASGVGAQVRRNALPLSVYWRDAVGKEQAVAWALCGGDDYRLCFTSAPEHAIALQSMAGLVCIGSIIAGVGVSVVDEDGVPCSIDQHGYSHF